MNNRENRENEEEPDQRKLLVLSPVSAEARGISGERRSRRMMNILEQALENVDYKQINQVEEIEEGDLKNRRVIFAINLSSAGVNLEFYRLLEYLRANENCLEGSVGGILVDGGGEMFTKGIARRMAFSANRAGCLFPGRSLVEATGSLENYRVLSRVTGKEPEEVYSSQSRKLVQRILEFPVEKWPVKNEEETRDFR